MRARRLFSNFSRCASALAIVGSAAFVAGESRADEPLPPETDTSPTTHPQSSAKPNLILIGAAVTAGWYGIALGTSYLWPDSDGAGSLKIPVLGPYMALAKTGCGSGEPNCDTVALVFRTVVTALSAVGQTGGLLAMAEGVFLQTSSGRAGKGGRVAPRALADAGRKPHVSVTPVSLGPSGVGLSLFGNF